MKETFLNRIAKWLWTIIVLVVVVLALYASLGRMITSNLGEYREDLVREFNARLDFMLEIDGLRGQWQAFTPRIELSGVRILGDNHQPLAVSMDSLAIEIDVWSSLLSRSPRFFVVQGHGGHIHLDVDEQGNLGLPGIAASPGAGAGSPLYDVLLNAEHLAFEDLIVEMHEDGAVRDLHLHAQLGRDGDFRRFQMSLLAPERGAWSRLVAEGTGSVRDLEDFDGRLHFQSYLGDLSHYGNWVSAWGLQPLGGNVGAEVWVDMSGGVAKVAAQLEGSSLRLQLAGDDGELLDLSGFDGQLAGGYRDGVWHFDLSHLALRQDGASLNIERLAGDFDGRRLALRTRELSLERLVAFALAGDDMPPDARTLLGELSPRGTLERAELTFPDVADLSLWRFESNFSALTVDSYRGAPGVSNASGFLSMGRDEGRVQLRSSEFSMTFPKVYRRALDYTEFNAELAWTLDDDAFRIRSGPFTAHGHEGIVRGVFALEAPFGESAAGIQMDLMVGLADTKPDYRVKYLPYTLGEDLLNWLEPSIGTGRIREGGFIWRGSLLSSPHRTVQLFFEVEDTDLDYHPQWPSLQDVSGLVLIDDADVDVYARSATLLQSRARDVLVQLRREADGLMLRVDGRVSGDAGDALQVVNESPLRDIVGDTFVDWSLRGPLETELGLSLGLSGGAAAPDVRVDTTWKGVELDTGPLGLQVAGVTGDVHFDTASGFSGEAIEGELWGRPIVAELKQSAADTGLGELDIAARGTISVESLRDWLGIDLLDIAAGSTSAEMHIIVPPGGTARLQVASQLEGVALDLPAPWGKSADSAVPLSLDMNLGGETHRVVAALDQALFLGVSLDEAGFAGASLGFGETLPAEEKGRFLLAGRLEQVSWDAWAAFVDRYLLTDDGGPGTGDLVRVPRMEIGRLEMYGQALEDILVGVTQREQSWELSIRTDWMDGELRFPGDLSSAGVDLQRLDMAGLRQLFAGKLASLNPSTLELPPVRVSIDELLDGSKAWGELAFELHDEGLNFHLRDLRGNLRGMQLGNGAGMELDWLRGDDGASTRLRGPLRFGDLAEVLENYNYDPIVETDTGEIELDLEWPGAPGDFALETVAGKLDLTMEDGRFLNTSGATEGTLRVVGILNLTEVIRQLSLDTSSMFQSGVQFDSIEGSARFGEGIIDVPSVDVKGRSSRFQFAGQANVPEGRIDGELVATLPIASNLPWVAALVSGLPAAAAVYVVSKLFTEQMDRFSSAVYSVEGPWDKPEARFERIFGTAPTRQPDAKANAGSDAAAVDESALDVRAKGPEPVTTGAPASPSDVSPTESGGT